MRNKLIIIFATFMFLIGCTKDASQVSLTRISTGDDTYNQILEIQVSNLKSTYLIDSPIPITIKIKNLGPKQTDTGTEFVDPDAQLFPYLTVWIEQDSNLKIEQINLPIENRVLIKQSETFEYYVDLSKVKALSLPGQYDVSIGHKNDIITDIGDWTGTLRSRSQKIKIIKKQLICWDASALCPLSQGLDLFG